GLGAWIYTASTGPEAELREKLVVDRHNLRAIYKALRDYQKDHDNKLPQPAELVASGKPSAITFLSAARSLIPSVLVPQDDQGQPEYRYGDWWFTYTGMDELVKTGRGDAGKAIIA